MISRLLLFVVLALAALPARADHAQDAFSFADRRKWTDAIQHAKKSGDATLIKLITWQYLLDPDSGATFPEITSFIANNPNWPEQKRLRVRAELALRDKSPSEHVVRNWLTSYPPLTGLGKSALAEALAKETPLPQERINALVRGAWKDGDFEPDEEKEILSRWRRLLTAGDHAARADRLLWEEKTAAVRRMLPLLTDDQRRLAEARTALIQNKRTAIFALSRVPKALQNDPGLIYDRMRYRARHGEDDGVREMLLKAPASVPYPEKWWRQREAQIRMAIDEKNYAMAEKLLDNHGQLSGSERADAEWLRGWLQLEFLKKPKEALEIFKGMYGHVSYPVSRARAAYWAARAAQAAGDAKAAETWFATASAYPTTFYGQLAIAVRYGNAPLKIAESPPISEEQRAAFRHQEIVRAVELALKYRAQDVAGKLTAYLIENAESAQEAALAAELGIKAGYTHLGVRGAKKALQRSIVLMDSAYPRPKTPPGIGVPRPLLLAIARQESEFDPRAVSPADAMGLTQILPSTAKEMAHRSNMRYDKNRLFEPEYNLTLGSRYLGRLIKSYSGSYVTAIAAYNAGPGNVRKWIKQFGGPGRKTEDVVNWIEKIPFAETRNYVQRVLENMHVYRSLENPDQPLKVPF